MSSNSQATISVMGRFAAAWGIVGVSTFLLSACFRLSQHCVAAWETGIGPAGWIVGVLWLGFMLYSEGYKGFQKGFSPRVAARAHWLSRNPSLLRCLLAPAFCMGYFGATRKRMTVTWCLTCGIIVLVTLVKLLPQPWRGIIDVGVIGGLLWGVVAMLLFCAKSLKTGELAADPEIS